MYTCVQYSIGTIQRQSILTDRWSWTLKTVRHYYLQKAFLYSLLFFFWNVCLKVPKCKQTIQYTVYTNYTVYSIYKLYSIQYIQTIQYTLYSIYKLYSIQYIQTIQYTPSLLLVIVMMRYSKILNHRYSKKVNLPWWKNVPGHVTVQLKYKYSYKLS